ncbi:Mur ligase family protein [Thermodesulfobacteriota bacterium]
MNSISLSELFRLSNIDSIDPIPKDLYVTGVSESTDELKAGMVFVARKGKTYNGHRFLDVAADKGACAAIVSREVAAVNGLPFVRVMDTAEALGKLCSEFYGNPSKRIRLIGVTGTDGKTTTSNLIVNVLQAAGKKVAIVGTIGTKINGETYPMKNTTPPAPLLQRLLAKAACAGNDYVVVEVSSHAAQSPPRSRLVPRISILSIQPCRYCSHSVFIWSYQ